LVYDILKRDHVSSISQFGDLGGELAARIARSTTIAPRLQFTPVGLGRATAFGLLRHTTELSGSTVYLPRADRLPLKNVPIVGRIGISTSASQLESLLEIAKRSPA